MVRDHGNQCVGNRCPVDAAIYMDCNDGLKEQQEEVKSKQGEMSRTWLVFPT